jgi:hypothetical protein
VEVEMVVVELTDGHGDKWRGQSLERGDIKEAWGDGKNIEMQSGVFGRGHVWRQQSKRW